MQTLIGKVSNSLRGRGEDWRAVGPTHRQNQWESHQLFISGQIWKHNTKLGNIVDVEGNAVESVADIYFDEVDGAVTRIGK